MEPYIAKFIKDKIAELQTTYRDGDWNSGVVAAMYETVLQHGRSIRFIADLPREKGSSIGESILADSLEELVEKLSRREITSEGLRVSINIPNHETLEETYRLILPPEIYQPFLDSS